MVGEIAGTNAHPILKALAFDTRYTRPEYNLTPENIRDFMATSAFKANVEWLSYSPLFHPFLFEQRLGIAVSDPSPHLNWVRKGEFGTYFGSDFDTWWSKGPPNVSVPEGERDPAAQNLPTWVALWARVAMLGADPKDRPSIADKAFNRILKRFRDVGALGSRKLPKRMHYDIVNRQRLQADATGGPVKLVDLQTVLWGYVQMEPPAAPAANTISTLAASVTADLPYKSMEQMVGAVEQLLQLYPEIAYGLVQQISVWPREKREELIARTKLLETFDRVGVPTTQMRENDVTYVSAITLLNNYNGKGKPLTIGNVREFFTNMSLGGPWAFSAQKRPGSEGMVEFFAANLIFSFHLAVPTGKGGVALQNPDDYPINRANLHHVVSFLQDLRDLEDLVTLARTDAEKFKKTKGGVLTRLRYIPVGSGEKALGELVRRLETFDQLEYYNGNFAQDYGVANLSKTEGGKATLEAFYGDGENEGETLAGEAFCRLLELLINRPELRPAILASLERIPSSKAKVCRALLGTTSTKGLTTENFGPIRDTLSSIVDYMDHGEGKIRWDNPTVDKCHSVYQVTRLYKDLQGPKVENPKCGERYRHLWSSDPFLVAARYTKEYTLQGRPADHLRHYLRDYRWCGLYEPMLEVLRAHGWDEGNGDWLKTQTDLLCAYATVLMEVNVTRAHTLVLNEPLDPTLFELAYANPSLFTEVLEVLRASPDQGPYQAWYLGHFKTALAGLPFQTAFELHQKSRSHLLNVMLFGHRGDTEYLAPWKDFQPWGDSEKALWDRRVGDFLVTFLERLATNGGEDGKWDEKAGVAATCLSAHPTLGAYRVVKAVRDGRGIVEAVRDNFHGHFLCVAVLERLCELQPAWTPQIINEAGKIGVELAVKSKLPVTHVIGFGELSDTLQQAIHDVVKGASLDTAFFGKRVGTVTSPAAVVAEPVDNTQRTTGMASVFAMSYGMVRDEAPEMAFRSGVKAISKAMTTLVGRFFEARGALTTADFLATPLGQQMVALLTGAAWVAVREGVTTETTRDFGDRVARELRVASAADMLGAAVSEVWAPTAQVAAPLLVRLQSDHVGTADGGNGEDHVTHAGNEDHVYAAR